MRPATAAAGLVSAAILFAPIAGSAATVQPAGGAPVAPAANPTATAIARTFMNDEAMRGLLRSWLHDEYRDALAQGRSNSTAIETRFPGIIAQSEADAVQAALASFDSDYDAARIDLASYIAANFDADYLRRVLALLTSPAGVRFVASAFNIVPNAAGDSEEARTERLIQSLSEDDRRTLQSAIANIGPPEVGTFFRSLANHNTQWMQAYLERKGRELIAAANRSVTEYIARHRREGRR